MVKRKSPENINFITVPATGYGASSGLNKKVIYHINQVGDGVVVGGGNLFENGEIDIDINALQALRKPLLLFSNSYGRIYGSDLKLHRRTDALQDSVLSSLIGFADVVLSRDLATKSHIDNLINHPRHNVSGCPSIFISNLAKEELERNKQKELFGLIAVRNPEQMNVSLKESIRTHSLTSQIIELMSEVSGAPPKILCNDQRDIEYASSFNSEILYTSDVYEYFQILSHVNLSVSFRVHTSLPLWSIGCPAINLSYDERSKSLIDTLKMSEYDIDIVQSGDRTFEKIHEKLDYVMNSEFSIPAYWQELQSIQDAGIDKFFSLIKDNK